MTQLFQARWESQEGEIFQRDKQDRLTKEFTRNFKFWATKTEVLTDIEWRRGFELVERDVEEHKSMRKAGSVFPPSYAEFIGICRTQTLNEHGFLEPAEAYRHASREAGKHARNRRWHDVLVHKTAMEVGFFEIANESEKKIAGRFVKKYLELFKRYVAGERFDIPENRQLDFKKAKPLSKEENHNRMAQLMQDNGWS